MRKFTQVLCSTGVTGVHIGDPTGVSDPDRLPAPEAFPLLVGTLMARVGHPKGDPACTPHWQGQRQQQWGRRQQQQCTRPSANRRQGGQASTAEVQDTSW